MSFDIRECRRVYSTECLYLYHYEMERGIKNYRPDIDMEVRINTLNVDFKSLGYSQVRDRISRGDIFFAGYNRGKPAGYIFSSESGVDVGEIDSRIKIVDREIYLYDAFTIPDYRGNGIYPYLISYAMEYYNSESVDRLLIFSTCSNTSSIRGILKLGFSRYQIVRFLELCYLRLWIYGRKKKEIESHFENEIH